MEKALLEIRAVEKSFLQPDGRKLHLLKGIDLQVECGQTVVVSGVSGSGKSTLLQIIGTLDSADCGRMFFSGEDISTFDDSRLSSFRNRTLGFVFQFHYLIAELSVEENVALPVLLSGASLENAIEKTDEALRIVGLNARKKHFPHQLSGGERQRAAIARAIVHHPQLLLADEPTGSLDYQTAEDVFNCLFSALKTRQAAMVIVTHNESLAQRCDRSFRLMDGKLISLNK